MRVKELMRTRNLVSVRPDDDLAVAAQMMLWAGVRHLPVLENDRVVGVLTERDLLRHRAEAGLGGDKDLVRTFMTAPAELVSPEDEVAAACALMVARKLGCLPVVDGAKLVGILTTSDVLASQITAHAESTTAGAPRVELAMKRAPASVPAYSPLLEAVGIMVERGVRHVPVTDEAGRVVGILSDRDIRTAIGDPLEALRQELTELEEMKVSSVMTINVITVREQTPLTEVARRFISERIGAIPVVDGNNHMVGIVSYVDVIQALLTWFDEKRGTSPRSSENQLPRSPAPAR